jgi:hypothetical protein
VLKDGCRRCRRRRYRRCRRCCFSVAETLLLMLGWCTYTEILLLLLLQQRMLTLVDIYMLLAGQRCRCAAS